MRWKSGTYNCVRVVGSDLGRTCCFGSCSNLSCPITNYFNLSFCSFEFKSGRILYCHNLHSNKVGCFFGFSECFSNSYHLVYSSVSYKAANLTYQFIKFENIVMSYLLFKNMYYFSPLVLLIN